MRRRLGASALVRNRAAVVGLAILVPLLLATVVPWLLTNADPNAQDLSQSLLGPSWAHPLGTDKPGRDVLARVIFGAAPTLLGAIVVVVISGVVGIPAGLFAGYYGGRTESIVMRILDALLAFPPLLLAILVVATFGRGLTTAVMALGIIYIPAMARLVRSVTLVQRNQAYVDAGRRAGLLRPADHLSAHPAQPRGGDRGPVEHRPGVRDPGHRGAQLPGPGPAATRPGLGLDALRRPVVPAPEPVAGHVRGHRHHARGHRLQPRG